MGLTETIGSLLLVLSITWRHLLAVQPEKLRISISPCGLMGIPFAFGLLNIVTGPRNVVVCNVAGGLAGHSPGAGEHGVGTLLAGSLRGREADNARRASRVMSR